MSRIKNFDELNFTDDFVFGKVMEDEILCKDLLECLLQQKIGTLVSVQNQKELQYVLDGKQIRLDLYAMDDISIYNAEMQNLNHRSIDSLELPKRSRLYQSMIDVDFMQRGGRFNELPDSQVIFICTFDPFGYGAYKYSFSEVSEEVYNIKLKSGTVKHFYNCTYDGKDVPENVRALYRYIREGEATNYLTKRLDAAVTHIKMNEQWRSSYMKERFIYEDYRQAGREEGREEGRISQLLELVQDGFISIADAAKKSKLTEEGLRELIKVYGGEK